MADAPKKKAATQQQFAALMGESQPAISKLLSKGVLTRGADIGQWLVEYGRHMRDVAAGWQSRDGQIDRMAEAAMLDRRKRELIEIQLEEKRNQLIPLGSISEALAFLAGTLRTKLLALPSTFRQHVPTLTHKQVDLLNTLVGEALTELSHERFPPSVRAIAEQYFSALHATAETDNQPVGGSASNAVRRKRGGTR